MCVACYQRMLRNNSHLQCHGTRLMLAVQSQASPMLQVLRPEPLGGIVVVVGGGWRWLKGGDAWQCYVIQFFTWILRNITWCSFQPVSYPGILIQ